MSGHILGQSRTQTTMFPEVLEDFVSEENPVRVVDVFVDSLELQDLGFDRVKANKTGRPGYHPAILLKLYIYGYLNRIQSTRRLEKEASRNVELMWLTHRLAPDFKTIADFRKDNGKAIKQVCRQFVELCRQMNMFSDAVFAIDGSKFKAVNAKSNNFTETRISKRIEQAEKNIEKYLESLDSQDKESNESSVDELTSEKLVWLQKRLAELKGIEEKVKAHPDKQISLTDPDSRLLITKRMERKVCYNVQSAVDTKHHLIVSHDVTNKQDRGQLTPMAMQVQEATGRQNIDVLADKGYFGRLDIKAAIEAGITPTTPQTDTSGSAKKGIFNKSLFRYDKDNDIYICPAGETLHNRGSSLEKGVQLDVYLNYAACKKCEIRTKCTRSKKDPRRMRRWVHEHLIDTMQKRLDNNPDITLMRKQTVEHPFGTLKMWMGATHFTTKRFKNVSTEMSLHVLAYNIKRMIAVIGSKGLMEAIQ